MSTKAEKEAAKRRARLQQQSAAAASEVESTVTKALATDSGTSAKPEKPPAPRGIVGYAKDTGNAHATFYNGCTDRLGCPDRHWLT